MRLTGLPRRLGTFACAAASDLGARRRGVGDDAIELATSWLLLTHEVTGRRGSSKGFSLFDGWRPAFPETTGYLVGTLLARTAETGDDSLLEHARQMGEWELDVQRDDGGIAEAVATDPPLRSLVFDTGMVLHGWLDLHEWSSEPRYLDAAARAGEFLVRAQDADGAWRGEAAYGGIPATYNARVAWALIRLARAAGDERFESAARRKLDWVISRQRPNGWFDDCVFKAGMLPSTHSIAYTLRGLAESSFLTGEARWRDAALRGAEPLVALFERLGTLPATYDAAWRPRARYVCLTGAAQLGGVWLRLHQAAGDERSRRAGLRAVELAAAHQVRIGPREVRGALAGSSPIFGAYAPLQFPNWAAKFLVDALSLRRDVLSKTGTARVPGSVPRAAPDGVATR